jgi:DNA polymerase-3 subunit epsilon
VAICIFDTETTSLNGDVVEFGSVVILDSGKKFHFNERCKPSEPISDGAYQTHGISDADVEHCRSSRTVVTEWYNDIHELALQEHEEIVLCAHNLAFDARIIKQHIDIQGIKQFCSLLAARKVYPDLPSKKLGDLYAKLGFTETVKAHSALDDCIMVERILPKFVPNYYQEAVVQMQRKAELDAIPPKFLETVNFGKKNKGKAFKDVSKSDLIWIYENMTNNKDAVYTAGVLLGKEQR